MPLLRLLDTLEDPAAYRGHGGRDPFAAERQHPASPGSITKTSTRLPHDAPYSRSYSSLKPLE